MRNDLTENFLLELNKRSNAPLQTLVFHFSFGDVFVSDRDITIGENNYVGWVEDWGTLDASVGGANSTDWSAIRQGTIVFWNGGKRPLSDYFLVGSPEAVNVDFYQGFAGLAEEDFVLIDTFYVADPIRLDEVSMLLSIDILNLAYFWDVPVNQKLTNISYPYASAQDIGAEIPLVFGSPGRINGLKAKIAKSTTLATSILISTTTITAIDDLDELAFQESGSIQIGLEVIPYTSRNSSSFLGCTRTSTTQHLKNDEIKEVLTDNTFVFSSNTLLSLSSVQIDGYSAPSGIYTVDTLSEPTTVVFTEAPYYERFSEGSRYFALQFDDVGVSNTALWPEYAYDAENGATGALMDSATHRVLALTQTTVNENIGEIRKVYLQVDAFTVGYYAIDEIDVSIVGIGSIGILTKPDSSDQIDIGSADVDIDHGHLHNTGAAHNHSTVDPGHLHPSTVSGGTIVDGGNQPLPQKIYNYSTSKSVTVVYTPYNSSSKSVHLMFGNNSGSTLSFIAHPSGTTIISYPQDFGGTEQIFSVPVNTTSISVGVGKGGVVGGYVYLQMVELTSNLIGSISNNTTGSAVLGQGADANDDPIKAFDDVVNLVSGNTPLNINSIDNPTRTITNNFDITDLVNFDWSWFVGKEVQLTYTGVADNKDIYILHAFFEIEFAPKEIVFSDNVSAVPTSALTEPVDCIDYLITEKTTSEDGIEEVSSSLVKAGHDAAGYVLNGLAYGNVREMIADICYNTHSRIFTSSGLIKIVSKAVDKAVAKAVSGFEGDLRLRSTRTEKQPLSDIANQVEFNYASDHYTADGFKNSGVLRNEASISRYGLRTKTYEFNFIVDAEMAAAVANYYLTTEGQPSTFYIFECYMNQFALEPEDAISIVSRLTGSEISELSVKGLKRHFGSGKNSAINYVEVIAEACNYDEEELLSLYATLVPDVFPMELNDICSRLHELINVALPKTEN